ncbi:acVLRF1 family peptidyl-tRNA hydrolase [Ornithinimicrobium sufpigmenti]|uniref:acVLRF1 family peptidyl-tRNA hydrolase n=1 Tax=Ornithinimicrobium sufpigmenti TaxID=2508882 RepID=UPI001035E299|nr:MULTISPECIES: acVLRF1 family peptidyl-tRNA hydrolase [unclassified Ornithinimicrobium]
MSQTRRVEVSPERLPGWVERFAASHGEVAWSVASGDPDEPLDRHGRPAVWCGQAADGSWARLEGWTDAHPGQAADGPLAAGARSWWAAPGPLLLLLVRRGGYAVAVATAEGELVAHKVGTRRVQGRTAAGGWSQQRFARRRGHQADELVEAAVGHARRILGEGEDKAGAPVGAVVLGGDPALGDQALHLLAVGPQKRLHGIPRRTLPDLADPRRAVLDDAVRRALAVRVTVHNAR